MKTEILIRFYDIPDHGGNAGWICHPGTKYVEGSPLGRGSTMREAFLFMLTRIEEVESERVMRTFGREIS